MKFVQFVFSKNESVSIREIRAKKGLKNPTEGRHHNPTEGRLGNPTEGRLKKGLKTFYEVQADGFYEVQAKRA